MPKLVFALMLALAVAIAGCEKKEPEPEAPPPPTPEEIAQNMIQQLGLNNPVPPPNPFNPEGAKAMLNQLRQFKTQHSATPDGKLALKIVENKLSDRTRAFEDVAKAGGDVWEFVLTHCQAYKILNETSKRFDITEQNAITQLKKPKVKVSGFFAKDGATMARVTVTLPLEGNKKEDLRVRVGQEFNGLKVVSVIGDMKGLRIEYLETGEQFDVYVAK